MMSPLRRGLAMGISSKQVLQGIAPPFENLFSLGQCPVLKLADSLAANTKLPTNLVESHNVVAKLHSGVALGVVVATHDRTSESSAAGGGGEFSRDAQLPSSLSGL